MLTHAARAAAKQAPFQAPLQWPRAARAKGSGQSNLGTPGFVVKTIGGKRREEPRSPVTRAPRVHLTRRARALDSGQTQSNRARVGYHRDIGDFT